MHDEHIQKLVEIGKKGMCTLEELSLFLPNLPTLRGSEPIFTIKHKHIPSSILTNAIKGCHIIERKYVDQTGNEFGFGSPTPTYQLIEKLRKINQVQSEEIRDWIAFHGGNYYIKPKS